METLDYITIGSAVLNFLLGGTTVWSIIQWLSEKKLRKIDEQSKETSLETQRFEALTQQIEYQKQLIAEFISTPWVVCTLTLSSQVLLQFLLT